MARPVGSSGKGSRPARPLIAGERVTPSGRPARPRPLPPKGGRKPPSGAPKRKGRGILYWLAVGFVWCVILVGGVVTYYAWDLPGISRLGAIQRNPTVKLVAADGSTFATVGDLYGEALGLRDLPPVMAQAVLATEDRRFFNHFGFDVLGLARAIVTNVSRGALVQGGSTITQQLAKNVFLTPERSLSRKIQEAILAIWLERKFSKEQILELYLNRVYLGAGAYGVDAASWRYFGHSARQVTLPEAAMLAGLLKAPSRLAPTNDLDAARARAAVVLDGMVDAGFITVADADSAKRNPATLARRPTSQEARYFADYVLDQVPEHVGADAGDLVVLTTLDPRLQREAETALRAGLDQQGQEAGATQGAVVAMATDGAVRALVGGRSYADSPFNRATNARRQPGSTFKLMVYAAALEAGYTPSTSVRDEALKIGDWSPENFEPGPDRRMTLAQAVARSVNRVAVRVALDIGIANVVAMARRLGITTDIPENASIALGTAEATVLEMAAAYAVPANGGTGIWPYAIVEIRNVAGTTLYRREGGGPGRVLSLQVAGQLNQMLAGVVRDGTGRAARLDRPAAGKTGTSQGFRDAWFVGYTSRLVTAVWLGNDDNTPMNRVTGGTLPARIWRSFMVEATAADPVEPLPAAPAPPAPVPAAQPAARPAGSPGSVPGLLAPPEPAMPTNIPAARQGR
ncbi:transglycosylase domain-containing protein [Zavarzinia sp. CC-PAN008]|uniref:transglycosylase domain-containing protein n=1 Tax=Zavarzinia sp. CC-PAN008 TaxID=3243332 RepID=UPI003F7457D8